MSSIPETRPSLLVRLRDRADDEAWFAFTEIYRPVIFRLASRRGMQPADADDLVQQVLTLVARSIDRWETDPARARFRTWLTRVATNAILNALSRQPHDRGVGGSDVYEFGEIPAINRHESELIRTEHRREVFRWAARQVQPEFQPETWRAFWETAVEGRGVEETARELQLSVGSIYAARSRVMRRLREKVSEWTEDTA
ncbi:MAG: sigma-70 family RNA polymerase sigma factor [Planctomycetes bacterium]|nr:sigma-70 family RNA polymerase sigma factor [Planctomycetota bacterium]